MMGWIISSLGVVLSGVWYGVFMFCLGGSGFVDDELFYDNERVRP